MAAFASAEVTLTAATATKLVDAADFDRRVHLYGDAVRVAFTSGTVSTGARLGGGDLMTGTSLVLPADEELWAYHSSGGPAGFFVTTVA
jgi:hypothetical protein